MIINNSSFNEDIFNFSYEMINIESSLNFYSNSLKYINESNKTNIFIRIKDAILKFIRKIKEFIKEKIFGRINKIEKVSNSTTQQKIQEKKKEIIAKIETKDSIARIETKDSHDTNSKNNSSIEQEKKYKVKDKSPVLKTIPSKNSNQYDRSIGPEKFDYSSVYDIEVPFENIQKLNIENIRKYIDIFTNSNKTIKAINKIFESIESMINKDDYNSEIIEDIKYKVENTFIFYQFERFYNDGNIDIKKILKYDTLVEDGKIKSLWKYNQLTVHGTINDTNYFLKMAKKSMNNFLKECENTEKTIRKIQIQENTINGTTLIQLFNKTCDLFSKNSKTFSQFFATIVKELENDVNNIMKIDTFIINKFGYTAIDRVK